jgi:tetratricopeptide (TPR) repeat protein
MVYGTLGKIYLELLGRERIGYGCFRQKIVLFGDLGRFPDQIQALGGLATSYEKGERYGDAIETLTQVIDVAEKQQLIPTIPWAFYNRGNLYAHLENLTEAEINYQQAITIAEQRGDQEIAASVLHNLAEVKRRQDRTDEAIPLLISAVRSAQQLGDVSHEITALNNLGLAYESLLRDEEALTIFHRALKASRQHYRKREEANILISFGNFYLERRDPRRAKGYYEESLDAARAAEDTSMEEASLLSLAYAHRQLGTFSEIADDFKVVAERSATLKHYKHLILFLTLEGEIDFDKGDIEGSIKMFEQAAMLALTVPIKRFGQLRYDVLELMSTSMLPKVVAKILISADRAFREGRIGDVESFCRGLREMLREERWGSVGTLLIENPIRQIELYLKERPDQDLLDYVSGDTDGND